MAEKRGKPKSLLGQILAAAAIALLTVQVGSAFLIQRAQVERRDARSLLTAAVQLTAISDRGPHDLSPQKPPAEWLHRRSRVDHSAGPYQRPRVIGIQYDRITPLLPGEARDPVAQRRLAEMVAYDGLSPSDVLVVRRRGRDDPQLVEQASKSGQEGAWRNHQILVAAIRQRDDSAWLITRIVVPKSDSRAFAWLIAQTVLLYVLIIGALIVLLRRITRMLRTLAGELEEFAPSDAASSALKLKGPRDVRSLVLAYIAMQRHIAAMVDEKDFMLRAIAHDLRTPLAALRIRIEMVDDEVNRGHMAAAIRDIVRMLDDILSLARVGGGHSSSSH